MINLEMTDEEAIEIILRAILPIELHRKLVDRANDNVRMGIIKGNPNWVFSLNNVSEDEIFAGFTYIGDLGGDRRFFIWNLVEHRIFTETVQEKLIKSQYWRGDFVEFLSPNIREKYQYLFRLSKVGII